VKRLSVADFNPFARQQTILKYYRKYRGYFIWGFLVLLGSSGFAVIAPLLLKEGIDAVSFVVSTGSGGFRPNLLWYPGDAVHDVLAMAVKSLLIKYALSIVALAIVGGVFRFYARRTLIWASRHIEYDLRNELFGHLLKLSASYYNRTPTGDIIARASNDIEAVRMMVGPAVMQLMNTVIIGVLAFSSMVVISPRLTLYSLLPLPLLSLTMWLVGQQIHRRFMRIQDHFSKMSAFVQESLSGIRIIKAFRREGYRDEKFREVNQEYVRLNLSLARLRAFFMPTIMFLVGLVVLTVLWTGGHAVINKSITLGEFVAFMVYLKMLIWPMLAVGWVISLYQRGTASLERIDSILNEKLDVYDGANLVKSRGKGTLRYNKLSFTYPGTNRQVLRDISFELQPGEIVAIVGPTGSGKSTLISLLVRKYPVADNAIFVDDIDINKLPLDDLRTMIGLVAQDPYLFSDTVAANIAFSQPQIDQDAVRSAAIKAALDNEIESFPQKYDTILGERGITLSGGQKQRAAIARALLKKPSILIFDDAFSSVDTQTEESILENLSTADRRTTTLLISHRPSTIRRADRVMVLDQGTIVEAGTHDELIAKQGRYYEIIRRELLASELELLD
jgi:ATP-binding cassette, subfamily B, multidrug efflux pump